jgi:hypothetical protein
MTGRTARLWRRRRHPTIVAPGRPGQAAEPAVELEDSFLAGDVDVDELVEEDDEPLDEPSEDDPVEDAADPPEPPDESAEAAAGAGVPAESPPVLPLRESVR